MPHALSRPPLPVRAHPGLHLPQLAQALYVPVVGADAALAVGEGVVGACGVEEAVAVGLVGEVLGPFVAGHLVAAAGQEGGVVGEGAAGAVVAGGAEGGFVWGGGGAGAGLGRGGLRGEGFGFGCGEGRGDWCRDGGRDVCLPLLAWRFVGIGRGGVVVVFALVRSWRGLWRRGRWFGELLLHCLPQL